MIQRSPSTWTFILKLNGLTWQIKIPYNVSNIYVIDKLKYPTTSVIFTWCLCIYVCIFNTMSFLGDGFLHICLQCALPIQLDLSCNRIILCFVVLVTILPSYKHFLKMDRISLYRSFLKMDRISLDRRWMYDRCYTGRRGLKELFVSWRVHPKSKTI